MIIVVDLVAALIFVVKCLSKFKQTVEINVKMVNVINLSNFNPYNPKLSLSTLLSSVSCEQSVQEAVLLSFILKSRNNIHSFMPMVQLARHAVAYFSFALLRFKSLTTSFSHPHNLLTNSSMTINKPSQGRGVKSEQNKPKT